MKWLGTGMAVAMAIYMTQSMLPLWFMLIPAVIDFIGIVTQNVTVYTED